MSGYPREIAALIRSNNATAVASRLALTSRDSNKQQFVQYMATRSYQGVLGECERVMQADWAEVVCHAVKASLGKRDGNLAEAYTHQEAAVESFMRLFKNFNRMWLPVLKVLLIDLRRLGYQADKQLRSEGKATEANKLEGAGRIMRKSLAQELRDEDNDRDMSRTHGALFVANQCNKISEVFFALNTLKHVKSLVLPPMLSLDEYPTPDRITWYFFQGRMALMESRFDQAETDLSFAFNNCPANHVTNRRLILRYKLQQFEKLVLAFRNGDVRLFDEALEEHQDFFVQKAIYILLHKLKLCVYRNLFKKAYHVVKPANNQIKLDVLVCAVKAAGAEADPQQVECMLANLIHQGMVKGYIAHKQQVVVLKKDDPFRVSS
ncbi:hypothetical protein GUITHDRAFT_137501 [Guillardia theta CCMP2712]|uniref:PCI domain-containing protein n=1 Tax=Guillardia theta (strain CCMP2712) TaxID=905079 RepID=L1JG88_GUITC|nr:hypothetical protein GUITHDRAFT_137501 [Guillardia theta CCMP2712]EKX47317.1 hypothetical protein GUITHDRAFT_137501 [Guillardia theta CCMP2712]|eukprot:XP_005834297.1 hypothetical protein GUITHDRAFT_137501 [Guillardia theta CCMP2712]